MTNKRSCKFCGETGHNIRSCTSAASARNLISKFGGIVRSEIPAVARKYFPISGFEGNMILMNFKLADISAYLKDEQYCFTDGFDYYQRSPIDDVINKLLKKAGSTNQYSDRSILQKMLLPVFEEDSLQLGFFVEEDSFSTHWSSRGEMSLVADEIEFKISKYIQSKLHEPGANKYKTIWRKICEHTSLTENYRGWEGNEGEMIRSFLKGAVRELQQSAVNKRTDPNKMFAVISSRLGRTEKAPPPESRCAVFGEWMNIEAPNVSFVLRESPHSSDLSFELTDKLKEELFETIKQPFLDALFSQAKCSVTDYVSDIRYYRNSRERDSIPLHTLYKLLNERSFDIGRNSYNRAYFIERLEVDNDVIYNEMPPPAIISAWESACKTNALSAESTVKDFVKMGHTGGYAQMFEKGLMKKIKFPGIRVELDLQVKNAYDGKWYGTDYVGRDYQASGTLDSFSLSEIVLAAMEALVYSERGIK